MSQDTYIGILSVISMAGGYLLLWFLWVKVFRERPEQREERLRREAELKARVLGEGARPRDAPPPRPAHSARVHTGARRTPRRP